MDFIGVGQGRLNPPLERIYVPLRLERARLADEALGREPERGKHSREQLGEGTKIELEAFAAHLRSHDRHGLIVGSPGAGKSAALRALLSDAARG